MTLWATGNLKSKSDSSKRPAGNPTPTSGADIAQTPKDTKPGKVKINVTWQYNEYVGSKPDTNAVVILVPKGFKGRVPSQGLHPVFATIGFDLTKKDLQQKGVYVGLVGGNGMASIAGVPPGDYKLIIISKNTKVDPELGESTEKVLAYYLDNSDTAKVYKVHLSEITVISGEEVEDSHDFGNTYH